MFCKTTLPHICIYMYKVVFFCLKEGIIEEWHHSCLLSINLMGLLRFAPSDFCRVHTCTCQHLSILLYKQDHNDMVFGMCTYMYMYTKVVQIIGNLFLLNKKKNLKNKGNLIDKYVCLSLYFINCIYFS